MRLRQDLIAYPRFWADPDHIAQRMLAFLASHPDVFRRTHPPGHFTGSALITEPCMERVALTLHTKLGKWLQFGGHADGESELALVALREAEEESGLPDLKFLSYEEEEYGPAPLPFDLDVHEIPAWGEDPCHLHYDVRYLLYTERPELLTPTHESQQVGWFTLEQARELCQEKSMQRQFQKLETIQKRFRRNAQAL